MKLLYIFLAHNRPEALVELATTLVEASTDAHAIVHFDLNAPQAVFDDLTQRVAAQERVHCVQQRVRCAWGRYGLVESVLNAIREARALALDFDYVVLLSGECVPSKPIRHLESYLAAHAGQEFIECHDENWMVNGLRAERYRFYFPLAPRPAGDTWAFRSLVWLQRKLGMKRKVPGNLSIRFGSQWWALTWQTCLAVLDLMDRDPSLSKFFRSVYIPDEMVFPTLVHHLVGERNIAGFGLTHYKFTDRGRPVVYYDDHGDYPLMTRKFFVRKISPEARALRARCLLLARSTDAVRTPISAIGAPARDYEFKTRAQTHFPSPGHLFYRDQVGPDAWGVLRTLKSPYVLLCGGREEVREVMDRLPSLYFQTFGFLFRPRSVGLGPGVEHWKGLSRHDWKIRDLHPLLYLMRVRQRVPEGRVCVLGWSPGDDARPLPALAKDDAGLVVTVPFGLPKEPEALQDLIPLERWVAQACEEEMQEAQRALTVGWSLADLTNDEKTSTHDFHGEPWFDALKKALPADPKAKRAAGTVRRLRRPSK